MNLKIINFSQEGICCEINPEDKVLHLKQKIQKESICRYNEISLYWNKICLSNEKILREYDIKEGDELHLLPNLKGGTDIFVRLISGKTIQVEIDLENTVKELKQKIREKDDHLALFNLLYLQKAENGREIIILEDHQKLSHYKITKETKLEVQFPNDRKFCGTCNIF